MCWAEGQTRLSARAAPNFLPVQTIRMSRGHLHFTFSLTRAPSVIMEGGYGPTCFTDEEREAPRGAGPAAQPGSGRAEYQWGF